MALDTTTVSPTAGTRRALLAGSLGALAAYLAAALGRPLPARAEGEVIHVGDEIATATSLTKIANTTNDEAVLQGSSGGSGAGIIGESYSGDGVRGETGFGTGVHGNAAYGVGVSGHSNLGDGVTGFSETETGVSGTGSSYGVRGDTISGIGVDGKTSASNMPAILGSATGNSTGVQGYSGSGAAPAAPTKTGVYGYAAQDANARGVTGQSTAGRGINGLATTGRGVHGQATSGTGGYFTTTTGTALRAVGPVRFSSAGLATISSGSKSVTVNPGLDITGASKVLTTLQTNPGGTTTIQRIARNTVANTFTIYLTANAAANTIVAWFLIS